MPVVVDSGSYIYTADLAARDAFRSSRAHNVLIVDRLDMHPLPTLAPFRMPAHASYRVEEWREDEREVVLCGSHDGYRQSGAAVRCRRRIALKRVDGEVEVTDEVEGHGRHSLESLLHLSPDCEASESGPRCVTVRSPGGNIRVAFADGVSVDLVADWVSSEYGDREQARVIRASRSAELPVSISYRIIPA
jgi:hypothetical protein